MRYLLCICLPLCLSVVMISPIPDQIVSQGAEVSLDVDSYFNEMILEYELLTPEFLRFSKRHLQPADLLSAKSQWKEKFVSVAHSHRFVTVLEEGAGIAVYEIQDQFQHQLVQHYFSDLICRNFTSITVFGDLLGVYNAHEIAIVDISNKFLPSVVTWGQFPFNITKIMLRVDNQILIATENDGLLLYEYSEETGIQSKGELSERFRSDGKLHPVDLAELWDRLFVLDRDHGLISVHTPWLNNPKEYNVKGSKLAQSDFNLVVDGHSVLHLSNDSVTQVPFIFMRPLHLAAFKEMVYISNGTHLGVMNINLNLTSIEEIDVRDLDLFNNNLLLVLSDQFKIRNYVPGTTTLSGIAPDSTGEYKIRFKARAKDGEAEANFSVIVESPPLEILLVLLAASTLALLFIVGCSLVLRKVIGLTPRNTSRHELNEERRSTDQLRAESFGASMAELPNAHPQV